MKTTSILVGAGIVCSASPALAFAPSYAASPLAVSRPAASPLLMSKGFGKKTEPVERTKSEGQLKREGEASNYDNIAATGGQEYNVFVRQFGSDDDSWFPCGSIAVPRGAQVYDAIYANEDALKKAIVRTYPKLAGFEQEFEFGSNLKLYPDEPVEVAMKGSQKSSGPSVGNWISNLLSPVDASGVTPPQN